MNSEASRTSANPAASAVMARHVAAIQRVIVDHGYAYDSDRLLEQKLRYMAENCNMVLDVGQSSRNFFSLFEPEKIETADINQRAAGLGLLRVDQEITAVADHKTPNL